MFKVNNEYIDYLYKVSIKPIDIFREYGLRVHGDANVGTALYGYINNNKEYLYISKIVTPVSNPKSSYNTDINIKLHFNKPIHLILDDIIYDGISITPVDYNVFSKEYKYNKFVNTNIVDLLTKYKSYKGIHHMRTALSSFDNINSTSNKSIINFFKNLIESKYIQGMFNYVRIPIVFNINIRGNIDNYDITNKKPSNCMYPGIDVSIDYLNVLYNNDFIRDANFLKNSDNYKIYGYPTFMYNDISSRLPSYDADIVMNKIVDNNRRSRYEYWYTAKGIRNNALHVCLDNVKFNYNNNPILLDESITQNTIHSILVPFMDSYNRTEVLINKLSKVFNYNTGIMINIIPYIHHIVRCVIIDVIQVPHNMDSRLRHMFLHGMYLYNTMKLHLDDVLKKVRHQLHKVVECYINV